MKDYFRLLRFVRPYRKLLGLAALIMWFSAIFDGASLSMIVPLADKVLTNKEIILPAQLPCQWIDRLVCDDTQIQGWGRPARVDR